MSQNNGLITKIWGGPGWIFMHSITFGYPINPTPEQKEYYKTFFTSIGNVLPCVYCRNSYSEFIQYGDTEITDAVLENRESLTKWFYRVHMAVNKKLDVDYDITYDDVVKRYESFRAQCAPSTTKTSGCVVPLDYKAYSYRCASAIDPPFIKFNVTLPFISLAKERINDKKYFSFYKFMKHYDGDMTKLKQLHIWQLRNNICQKQIQYMRINSVPSIEPLGKYKGMPTIDELKLLLFMSSNLCGKELQNIVVKS